MADILIQSHLDMFARGFQDKMIVFCKTDYLASLFEQLSKFKGRIILISGQSDYEIDARVFQTRPPCVVKWFAQNANYQHPDLIPIPIGLESHDTGSYTDWDFLKVAEFNTKTNLTHKNKYCVYCNFRSTHPSRKETLNTLVRNNVACSSTPKSYADYWKEAAKYAFVASPRGNGIDCHRTWETLMMGSIPIVEKHFMYDAFDLPILQVSNWSDIGDLEQLANQFNGRSMYALEFPYWKEKILKMRDSL